MLHFALLRRHDLLDKLQNNVRCARAVAIDAALSGGMLCRFVRFIFAWLPKIGVQPKLKQFGMVVKVRPEALAFNVLPA